MSDWRRGMLVGRSRRVRPEQSCRIDRGATTTVALLHSSLNRWSRARSRRGRRGSELRVGIVVQRVRLVVVSDGRSSTRIGVLLLVLLRSVRDEVRIRVIARKLVIEVLRSELERRLPSWCGSGIVARVESLSVQALTVDLRDPAGKIFVDRGEWEREREGLERGRRGVRSMSRVTRRGIRRMQSTLVRNRVRAGSYRPEIHLTRAVERLMKSDGRMVDGRRGWERELRSEGVCRQRIKGRKVGNVPEDHRCGMRSCHRNAHVAVKIEMVSFRRSRRCTNWDLQSGNSYSQSRRLALAQSGRRDGAGDRGSPERRHQQRIHRRRSLEIRSSGAG